MTNQSDETGTRLFLGENMGGPELIASVRGSVAAFSARSPAKEDGKRNEDSFAIYTVNDQTVVIAVADGMGGQPMGGEAADIAMKELHKALRAAGEPDQIRPAILDGVEHANAAIKALGVGAATTLLVAQIQGDTVRSYHAGDSHMLLVGNRGKVRFQTIAHSPVGYAVEAGVLDERGAMYHEDRHLVSNMLGSDDMHITVSSKVKMQQLDTLLLGSDGLFDNLHVAEIVETCRKGPLKKAADKLRSQSVKRMAQENGNVPSKPDDLTFVLFRSR